MIYENLQIAQSAKKRFQNHETKIKFSEMKMTHAALSSLKDYINEAANLPDITSQEKEEIKSMRHDINKSLRFLRAAAYSFGLNIDEYISDDLWNI